VEFTTSEPTFGIPATITPMTDQVSVTPAYDPKATILVRKGYYYGAPSDSIFEVENADDISRTYWRLDALKETNDRNSRAQDKVKEYLIENYEEIGSEHSDEIARILGIDLHKTVDVVFDVTIRATVTIPMNKDVDDLSVYDFNVTIESNESDYEIEEFDADINSVDED
jgi:hypothetical protein